MSGAVSDFLIILISTIAIVLFALFLMGDYIQYVLIHIFSETAWDVGNDVATALFLLNAYPVTRAQITLSYDSDFNFRFAGTSLRVTRLECLTFTQGNVKQDLCVAEFPVPSVGNFEFDARSIAIIKENNEISVVNLS